MNMCKHFHVDGAMHVPCHECRVEALEAENAALRAQLDGIDACLVVRQMKRIKELREALEKVLVTRSAETTAQLSYEVANENYTDPKPESEAWGNAMIAASVAEKQARDVLAKYSTEDDVERARRKV